MKKIVICNKTMVNKKPEKKIMKSSKGFDKYLKNDCFKISKVKILNGTNYKKNHNETKKKGWWNHKRNFMTLMKDHEK